MNWYIILFFLLALAFYLYTQYIRLQRESHQEKIEAFQSLSAMTPAEKLSSHHGISLVFLPASQASRQMQSNAQEYIARMNQPNLAARGVQSQQELMAAYTRSFQDITTAEQNRTKEFVLDILSKIQYKYPAYYRYIIKWLSKISLAKSQASLEGGMPHTLGSLIVMDAAWFANPRATTFLHEITHIHQRQVPFEFEDLYTKWGYLQMPMSNIRGMESIILLNRNNPDGMSPDWLWRASDGLYWWIGAIFSNATPTSLSDINLIAVKMEKDAEGNFYYLKQMPKPLDTLNTFLQYFGGSSPNNYHPNEMAAKFAEWYLEEMLGLPRLEKNINTNMQTGYQIYRDYFKQLLETYY
jgi:hypothetical protein